MLQLPFCTRCGAHVGKENAVSMQRKMVRYNRRSRLRHKTGGEGNLNRYIEVAFSGYDGYGTAEVSFQYDKFRKDHKDLILNRSQMDDSLAKALDDMENGKFEERRC